MELNIRLTALVVETARLERRGVNDTLSVMRHCNSPDACVDPGYMLILLFKLLFLSRKDLRYFNCIQCYDSVYCIFNAHRMV